MIEFPNEPSYTRINLKSSDRFLKIKTFGRNKYVKDDQEEQCDI